MIETAVRMIGESVEENLRAELARGDALTANMQPILRHLLAEDAGSIFSDEVIAHVRGMQSDLARQLLAAGEIDAGSHISLVQALAGIPQLVSHIHALALEWQLTLRIEQQYAIDTVVSPLLQALIASPEPETQGLAMKLLASQARWCQAQRRMQLPASELPGELFHAALLALRSLRGAGVHAAETRLRSAYDEATSRLALADRLVASMGNAAAVALDLRHGGATLFASALAWGSGRPREEGVLAMHGAPALRLCLGLRAAGLAPAAVAQQIVLLQGEASLPPGFERLSAERAAALLRGQGHDAAR